MQTATRFLNLLAGFLVFMTGVYIQVNFDGVFTDLVRLFVSVACAGYFFLQLWRQITTMTPIQHADKSGGNSLEF